MSPLAAVPHLNSGPAPVLPCPSPLEQPSLEGRGEGWKNAQQCILRESSQAVWLYWIRKELCWEERQISWVAKSRYWALEPCTWFVRWSQGVVVNHPSKILGFIDCHSLSLVLQKFAYSQYCFLIQSWVLFTAPSCSRQAAVTLFWKIPKSVKARGAQRWCRVSPHPWFGMVPVHECSQTHFQCSWNNKRSKTRILATLISVFFLLRGNFYR